MSKVDWSKPLELKDNRSSYTVKLVGEDPDDDQRMYAKVASSIYSFDRDTGYCHQWAVQNVKPKQLICKTMYHAVVECNALNRREMGAVCVSAMAYPTLDQALAHSDETIGYQSRGVYTYD